MAAPGGEPGRIPGRQVWVVRHAHAVDHWPGGDHDRPLAPRGRRDVAAFGDAGDVPGLLTRALADGCRRPDLVVSSSAVRARGTAEGACAVLGLGAPEIDRSLYRADADDLLAWLSVVSDDVAAVMIVGHNPAVHDLVALLGALPSPSLPTPAPPATSAVVVGEDHGPEPATPTSSMVDSASAVPTRFTPGSVAVLALDIDRWVAVAPGVGRVLFSAVT